MEHKLEKRAYQRPTIVVFGTLADLTQGARVGGKHDKDFPVGTHFNHPFFS